MNLPELRPHPGNLRAVAEEIEKATGLRVEVLGGKLVMSPTPRGKHAGTIRRVRLQLESRLPGGMGAYEVSSIALPDDPDDYCTPDLVVLPVEWDEDDDWLADPGDVELALEVISKSERAKGITDKDDWYAIAGVRLLLTLDPRVGTWSLHSHPGEDGYRGSLSGEYGEQIPLPEPFSFALDTADLPRYSERP